MSDLSRPIPNDQLSARVQALEMVLVTTVAYLNESIPNFTDDIIEAADVQRRHADGKHALLSFALEDLTSMMRSLREA